MDAALVAQRQVDRGRRLPVRTLSARGPLILLAGLIAGGWSGATTDELLGRARSGSTEERIQALVAISQVQQPDPSLLDGLIELLATPDKKARRATAYAIAQVAIALGCEASALDACSALSDRYDAFPKVKKHPPPVYPGSAASARLEGTVTMQLLVTEDGTVRDVRVVSGPRVFHDTAVETLRSWEFEPAQVKGKPVPFVMVYTIHWRLS
jgi:TonB family protein